MYRFIDPAGSSVLWLEHDEAVTNLCFSSPVELASGRNSWFSSGPLFQLSAAAAVPDQKRSQEMKRF